MLILDAVITLLAERGLDGVTHRAVDEVAKIPQGSTSYYYRRKPDLLNAACEYLAELLEKDCDELQVGFSERAASEGVDAAVEYVAEELADYTDGARHLFLARLELTPQLRDRITLQVQAKSWLKRQEDPSHFF